MRDAMLDDFPSRGEQEQPSESYDPFPCMRKPAVDMMQASRMSSRRSRFLVCTNGSRKTRRTGMRNGQASGASLSVVILLLLQGHSDNLDARAAATADGGAILEVNDRGVTGRGGFDFD